MPDLDGTDADERAGLPESSEMHESEDAVVSTSEKGDAPPDAAAGGKKKRKKKKKGSGGADSDSTSSSSSSSSDSTAAKVPPDIKAEVDRKFAAALDEATKDREEIISLDGCYLRNSQLNKLIARLEHNRQLITLVLTNNLLSDDACKALNAALSNLGWCPELMSVDVRGNKNMTEEGLKVLERISETRPGVHVVRDSLVQEEAPREVFEEMLQAGALHVPDAEPRASPAEQWAALEGVLQSEPGHDFVSRISELVRDVSDAVSQELFKEEVLEGATFEGAATVPTMHTVFLPPREYANFAIAKLSVIHRVLDIVPRPLPTPTGPQRASGIGSHRFHASVLVCQLVKAALSTPAGASMIAPLVASNLLPRVAHLALSHPNSSCMHATLLGALEEGALASMPEPLWRPLLGDNFGLSPEESWGAKPLAPLPDIIMQHATKALKQKIGQRSGIVGLVVVLGSVFADTVESNAALKAALESNPRWVSLVQPGGPLDQLKSEQAGGLGGGKPAALGDFEEPNSNKEISRVMLGIRDFSFMHQSLNLAAALH